MMKTIRRIHHVEKPWSKARAVTLLSLGPLAAPFVLLWWVLDLRLHPKLPEAKVLRD